MPDWFERDDPHLSDKMRQVREIAAAQRELGPAVEKAIAAFLNAAREALLYPLRGDSVQAQAHLDAWPDRDELWKTLLTEFVFGVLEELFTTRFRREVRGEIRVNLDALIDNYLDEVWQRLASWPDDAFAEVRTAYADAIQAGLDETAIQRRLADMLRLDAPSPRRRAEMDQLQRTINDPATSDGIRRQARQRLASLRRDDSRRGKLWWPSVAELTRTQALAALNAGTAEGADAYAEATGEARYKVWWSAEDQRVRPAHDAAHGQIQRTGEMFTVGGFPMRYPGDPAAPPDLVLNCRCSLLALSAAEASRIRQRSTESTSHRAGGVSMTATTAETAAIEPEAPKTTPPPQDAPVLAVGDEPRAEPTGNRWRGVLAPLDRRSPDGRVLARPTDDQVLHRTLPLPLLYQEKTGPGHDDAVIVGNIQRVWVDGDLLMGEGTFDLGNPAAREVRRQIEGGYHRWVSITHDPDADYTFKFYRAGEEIDPAEAMGDTLAELMAIEEDIEQVRIAQNWRISDATLVATPAFDEAAIALLDDEDEDEVERRKPVEAMPAVHAAQDDEGYAVSAEKRERAEKSGAAMPGGRYPIENVEDLKNAIRAVGRAGGPDGSEAERNKVRRHILKRARALGKTDLIPDTWNSDGTLKNNHALIAAGGRVAWCEKVAGAVPFEPPSEWFTKPELPGYTKPTITDEGRLYGHICPWGVTHAGDSRTQPPRHGTDAAYSKFHRHPVRTSGGGRIMTGPLASGGHAQVHASSLGEVMRHYDKPDFVIGNVVVGEDEHGIWFSGALRPGVTPLQILSFDQYFVSGDWRNGELLAACVVSVPGFHRPGAQIDALAASGDVVPIVTDATPRVRIEDGEVVALIAAGLHSAPVLGDRVPQPAAGPLPVDPEKWGERIGRGMYAGLRQAEDEARQRAAAEQAERERRERVAEFRRRVGPPPQVLALRRRVLGESAARKVSV